MDSKIIVHRSKECCTKITPAPRSVKVRAHALVTLKDQYQPTSNTNNKKALEARDQTLALKHKLDSLSHNIRESVTRDKIHVI